MNGAVGRRLASAERHVELVLRHGPGLTVDGGGAGVFETGEEDGVVRHDRHVDVDGQVDLGHDGVRRRIDECGGRSSRLAVVLVVRPRDRQV